MNLKDITHRFLHNAAMIVGSRIVFGLLNLATNAIVVKAFGLADLGVLVLLQVYTRLFNDLVKFNTWQTVLSFGAPLQEAGEPTKLRQLIGFTLSLDLLCVSLALLGAVVFTPLASQIFEWPETVSAFAPYFALSLLFMLQGTPNGVLRFVNRVDVLAWQFAMNAMIRFFGVLLVILLNGEIIHLVLVWFAANVLSGMLPLVFCYRILMQRELMPLFDIKWREANRHFHRIWRFLWMTNASKTLSLAYERGTILVVGILLGPVSAATFQIAKQFSSAISKPSKILGPLISPEFATLAAQKNWLLFRKLIARQLIITFGVLAFLTTVLFLVLQPVIDFVYGQEVIEYLNLFMLLIGGSLLTMVTFSFEPAVLSANKPNMVLWLRVCAVSVYILTTAAFFVHQEIYAFGTGFVVSQLVYTGLFTYLGVKLLNKRIKRQTDGV